jgi:integrase
MASFRKRGDYQWEVRVRRRGYPLACKTFTKRADAENWAATIESEMSRGLFIDRSEAERTTLKEALERYLREITPSKKGHQEAYVVKAWLRDPLALRSLASIQSKDLADYRDDRLKEVGPKTVTLHLGMLSHLFNVARMDWGMESLRNPVESMRKPKLPSGRERRLEDAEEERLLAACEASGRYWLSPIVKFAIETAMRRGELVGTTWLNIKRVLRILHIPTSKNGEARDVPLSSRALAILDELPASIDRRVFPVTADMVTREFAAACAAAGIENLHFHDLRHEGTSRLYENTSLRDTEIAAITGHKTLQMLKRYAHLRAVNLVESLG